MHLLIQSNMTPQEEYELGLACFKGENGHEKDYDKAFLHFQNAAQHDNPEALNKLGVCHLNGFGTPKNHEKALELLQKAASLGCGSAWYNLGVMYANGEGVEQDYAEARKWWLLSAEQGNANAQYSLGVMYNKAYGVSQDYAEARKWYKLATEQGVARAQYNLGLMHFKGNGVEQNYREAFKLFRQSAGNGYVPAQLFLGEAYCSGQGVSINYNQAVFWWRKAARQGFRGAMYNLGCAYAKGLGVSKNLEAAKKWWEMAAELEDENAKQMLLFEDNSSFSFKQDYISKKDLITLSEKAEKGDTVAQVYLGDILSYGFSASEEDGKTAIYWYDKASRGNNPEAKFKLAGLYFGQTVSSDVPFQDPRMLLKESADQGYKRARMVERILKKREEKTELSPYGIKRICEKPYFLDEIIFQKYGDTLSRDDLFRVLLVLYAFHSKQALVFNGKTLSESSSWDPLLTKLYKRVTSADSAFAREKELQEAFSFLEFEDFEEQYRETILEVVQRKDGFLGNPITCPPPAILEKVAELFKEKGKTRVYCPFAGAGLLSMFLPENASMILQESSGDNALISEVLASAAGLSSYKVILSDPIDNWQKDDYDCVVCLTPLRRCSYADFDVDEYQEKVLNRIIANDADSDLLAIILTDQVFNTSSDTNAETIRRKILSSDTPGFVERVIEYPKGLVGDISMNTSLLVLTFSTTEDSIEFEWNGEKKNVPLDEIVKKKYSLNPRVYMQSPKGKDGQEVVRLGDLLKFDLSDEKEIGSFVRITADDYTTSLLRAFRPLDKPMSANEGQETFWLKYKGPTLFLRFDGRVRIFCNESDTYVSMHDSGVALKAGDKVSIRYLSYLLLNDRNLARYLREITDESGVFNASDFLNYELAVDPERPVQDQIVEQALMAERQATKSLSEYRVMLISDQCEDLSKRLHKRFDESSLKISRQYRTVEEYEKVREQILFGKEQLDAIILDVRAGCFEDIVADYKDLKDKNVFLYLLSDNNDKDLGLRPKERAYYVDGGRIFHESRLGDSRPIIDKIRDDLDPMHTPDAEIRKQYSEVFEAIEHIDKQYDIDLEDKVIKFIRNGYKIDDDPVSGVFGTLRLAGHGLINILQDKKLVPPTMDPGAIPSLLADKTYNDKKTGKRYYQYVQIMPQYLANALRWFFSETNAGVHGSQDSSMIGHSALYILMDFILWFHQNENKLEVPPPSSLYWGTKDDFKVDTERTYIVECLDGEENYYYCENVHLQPKKGLCSGCRVKFRNLSDLPEENKPVIKDGLRIVFFAKENSYDIIAED